MKVKTFSQRFDEALEIRDVSTADVARATEISAAMLSQYRSGRCKPKQNRLEEIAKYFNVSEAWMMGYDVPMNRIYNVKPVPKMKKIPLYGAIACGTPIMCDDNVEREIGCPENLDADFCLTCRGDSMIGARINDGDLVFIRKQPDVDDGQIAAVMIPVTAEEGEATLKRVYHATDGSIILQSENPKFPPMILKDAEILGLAVSFYSNIK